MRIRGWAQRAASAWPSSLPRAGAAGRRAQQAHVGSSKRQIACRTKRPCPAVLAVTSQAARNQTCKQPRRVGTAQWKQPAQPSEDQHVQWRPARWCSWWTLNDTPRAVRHERCATSATPRGRTKYILRAVLARSFPVQTDSQQFASFPDAELFSWPPCGAAAFPCNSPWELLFPVGVR